jgi:hypothetical protein
VPSKSHCTWWENQRENDTDRYELNRSFQASHRRGRETSTGSKPIAKNGLPVCVLPTEGPYPGSPDRTPRPGRTLQEASSCRDTRLSNDASPDERIRHRRAWTRASPMADVGFVHR